MNDPIKTQSEKQGCMEIFGTEHPMDVIYPLEAAASSLSWLGSLFTAIAADPKASPHIKSLARIGNYLAEDLAAGAYSDHDQFFKAIETSGAA